MKKLLIFTLLIAAVTLAGLWSGRKVCTMMSPADSGAKQALNVALGLSPAQTESFKKTESSFQKEIGTLCMQICREHANLLAQMKDGKISAQTADQKVEEIGGLQISLEKKIIAHIAQLDKILTPSQIKTYIDKIYQRQCQMMG